MESNNYYFRHYRIHSKLTDDLKQYKQFWYYCNQFQSNYGVDFCICPNDDFLYSIPFLFLIIVWIIKVYRKTYCYSVKIIQCPTTRFDSQSILNSNCCTRVLNSTLENEVTTEMLCRKLNNCSGKGTSFLITANKNTNKYKLITKT